MDNTQEMDQAAEGLMDNVKQLLRLFGEKQRTDLERYLHNLGVQVQVGRQELNSLSTAIAGYFRQYEKTNRELLERIADLEGGLAQQKALLVRVLEAKQTSGTSTQAYPVLIATHDQLGIIVAAGGPHAAVVAGQRGNIEQLLAHAGVVPLTAATGTPFDAQRMRSDDTTVPTSEESLAHQVAEVVEGGWQFADGTRIVRVPKVRLYRFVAPAPPAPAPLEHSDRTLTPPHDGAEHEVPFTGRRLGAGHVPAEEIPARYESGPGYGYDSGAAPAGPALPYRAETGELR